MAKRAVLARLRDILEAISDAREILGTMEFGEYKNSVGARRGIERCVEIVSEASRHIPQNERDRYPSIPWPEIRGIGNRLRHHYQTVDDLVIWRVARVAFDELEPAIRSILISLESETKN